MLREPVPASNFTYIVTESSALLEKRRTGLSIDHFFALLSIKEKVPIKLAFKSDILIKLKFFQVCDFGKARYNLIVLLGKKLATLISINYL